MKDLPSLLFILMISCTLTSAQSPAPSPALPPALGPAPPGPTNLTAVLEKAGRFTTFIRLLQNTKVGDQIHTQLNNSDQGMTVFAPTDAAFTALKPGMLNSFTDEQKVELIQFHVLPTLFSPSQFQTASNPLRTQAGGNQGAFPLNVTATGDNQLNITTGVTNATVANTVYTDNQIAVYEVDHVLLPLSFFTSPSPAPAPSKSKKAAGAADSPSGSDSSSRDDKSSANSLSGRALCAVACAALVIAAFPRTA